VLGGALGVAGGGDVGEGGGFEGLGDLVGDGEGGLGVGLGGLPG